MIYLESVVFGTSENRNLLCILNWKLKPQWCKNLGRSLLLCIMNISLQNSKLQCSTYFFLLLLYTKLFTLLYSWASFVQIFISNKKVHRLSDFLKLFFVCHVPPVTVDTLQYYSCFTLQLDLIYELECVLHLLYIMNKRSAFLGSIAFNWFL